MNNGCREDRNNNNSYCYFHPREVVIGVCPLCLNERLLILASTQLGRRSTNSTSSSSTTTTTNYHNNNNNNNNSANYAKKKPPINFYKIFDFGSLLHRLEFRPWKSDLHDDHDGYVSTSQEDSFISIKFEENGKASWEKNHNNKVSSNKVSLESCNKMSWNHYTFGKEQHQPNKETKTVIEHGKPRASSLRWRKRIGHVFHLIRWKRSNKAGTACHVTSKVEGVKVRKGWIRTLTKKKRTDMD